MSGVSATGGRQWAGLETRGYDVREGVVEKV